MFEKKISILKSNEGDKVIVDHQLTDLIILVMQVANIYETNFDEEITNWFEKSKKYIK